MADVIVTTLLNTGLRVDELFSPDVVRPGPAASLWESLHKRGKGDKARVVPLERRCARRPQRNPAGRRRRTRFPREARAIRIAAFETCWQC